jgi:predicted 3-demethylubiquinone-9 3-methyltransferase (glyoxalase superfamily)
MNRKIVPCLWYDKNAEEAANFYAATFPDSHVDAVHKSPLDYPNGKEGDVITVEFTVFGMPFLGLNGGPNFTFDEAVSFQVQTEDQEETDRYWNAIVGNGGSESVCGWCKDRFGMSWQITPRVLNEFISEGGERGRRAMQAMMGMVKIDIAALEAAVEGGSADA